MGRRRRHLFLAATAAAALVAAEAPAWAGMPRPYTLTDLARMRLEAVSFFGAVLLAAAAVVRWAWNSLHAGFPRLPRLDYPRAVGLVVLWGLLFAVVLAMIAGARELMTPGAWEPAGATYRLKGAP